MTYALIKEESIELEGYPRWWFDGVRFWDFREEIPPPSTGWLPVVETLRPEDTDLVFYTRSLELIDGQPTEVWIEHQKPLEEIERRVKEQNRARLHQDAVDEIVILRNSVTELNTIFDLDELVIRNNIGPIIKTLVRIVRVVVRQSIRVSKLATDDTLDVDTGI